MTNFNIKEFLENLTGHIMFEYNGYLCGVDPLFADNYTMWYGAKCITATSIDEVMNRKFFDGKSLSEIEADIVELEY